MKANLKGLSGVKGLVLRHGEKILITLAGLLAAYFIYASLSLPSLEDKYQAESLRNEISQTNTAIDTSRWPEPGSEAETEVRITKPVEKNANFAIKPSDYQFGGINPPVVAPTVLRTDPLVLNAEDVKVYGGSGLLAFRDETTMKEQERRLKLKEAELARKQAEDQAKSQQEGAEFGAAPGVRRGNRRGQGGELAEQPFDPDHPNRKALEGMGSPEGVPLQGGERLDRAYWATVVAKVPIREQLKLFQDAFQNARGYDPARDFPQYVGYVVERTEMAPGVKENWQRVYVYDGQKKHVPNNPAGKFVNVDTVTKLGALASAEWAGQSLEPVDSRWTDMLLTMPLPPLVGRNFAEDATHPDIPLAINAPPAEEVVDPAAAALAQTPAEGDEDEDVEFRAGAAAPGQVPMAGPGFGAGPMSRFGPGGGGEFGGRPMYGPPGGGEFGGMGRGEFGPGGGAMVTGGIAAGQRTSIPKEVDYLLLRFFDYTVQPGKEYKYRVKIVLNDPNAVFAPSSGVLASEVIDRRVKLIQEAKAKKGGQVPFYRIAEEWVESDTVGIPTGGMVHVAEAKQPSTKVHNDEPAVTMIAETFDMEPEESIAIHVAHEKDFRRGSVINLNEKMKYTGENDRWIDVKDSYELNTGLTVVDIEGSEKLEKDMLSPTRVLLMDSTGELVLRDETADRNDVKYLRYLLDDDRQRQGIGGPGGGGEFGGPGLRGGPGRGGPPR